MRNRADAAVRGLACVLFVAVASATVYGEVRLFRSKPATASSPASQPASQRAGYIVNGKTIELDAPAQENPNANEGKQQQDANQAAKAVPQGQADDLSWIKSLDKASAEAMKLRRPILILAGGKACPACRVLQKDIDSNAELRKALRRWTLAYVDIDESPREAMALGVTAIPTMNLSTPTNDTVDSKVGYIPPDEFVKWLDTFYKEATAPPMAELTGNEPPNSPAVVRLLTTLGKKDAVQREAAIRRLMPFPQTAALPVVHLFADSGLAVRLSVLELLMSWNAPIDAMDPWQPDTISDERIEQLRSWAEGVSDWSEINPTELTPETLERARSEIKRYIETQTDAEAEVIRERLARHGKLLLPEVYHQLELNAANVAARERLTALRYRLVATDRLVFAWPGGVARLASTDASVCRDAVEALEQRATAEEADLLLELFGSPDPLVREISLRALRSVGGDSAGEALVGLLKDPELNVRAAVLKQLAESPSQELAPKLAGYVATEQDADLIVHAARVLREIPGDDAVRCLSGLLKHESWQVRAEAAEALGVCLSRSGILSSEVRAEAFALMKVAAENDPDPFVVDRLRNSLNSGQGAQQVLGSEEGLLLIRNFPEMASTITRSTFQDPEHAEKAREHLRELFKSDKPSERAAAITGLANLGHIGLQEEMLKAVNDSHRDVRIAAAEAWLTISRTLHPTGQLDAQVSQMNRDIRFQSNVIVDADILMIRESTDLTVDRGKVVSMLRSRNANVDLEAWLGSYRAGEDEPLWREAMVVPFEKMLESEDTAEKQVAARALVTLGREEKALPILLDSLAGELEQSARTQQLDKLTELMIWLPWESRVDLFQKLLIHAVEIEGFTKLLDSLVPALEPQATGFLWELAAGEAVTSRRLAAILHNLRSIYEVSAKGEKADSERAFAEIQERLASRSESEMLMALVLLTGLDQSQGAGAARAVFKDADLAMSLRIAAMKIRLLADSPESASLSAIEFISDENEVVRQLALEFLARGADAVNQIQDGQMDVFVAQPSYSVTTYMKDTALPVEVTPPPGLTKERVQPLLASESPRTTAVAGYLLCLLGEESGLDPLIEYWKDEGRREPGIARMVYRAIAKLNSAEHVSVLDEIYQGLDHSGEPVRDFYWTIRGMSGLGALELRSKIRDEVGMEELR